MNLMPYKFRSTKPPTVATIYVSTFIPARYKRIRYQQDKYFQFRNKIRFFQIKRILSKEFDSKEKKP